MTPDRAQRCPRDLPVHLTPFIGRDRELDELVRLVGSAHLLTLTGAGGSGKTRLAGEVAARSAGGFSRVAWADLAPVTDGALLAGHVAAALRAPERPDASPIDWVVEAVGDERVLLVLDNCEHLVEACAVVAEALLRACRGMVVIATSREALGVPSETAWLVPPLAGADAVHLFVERARGALPAFVLTAENGPAVDEICRRLDGIPLAIELAAARVRVLAPEQIAARLDDAFRLLTTGSRTALPRHRTLRATMEWSFGLLDDRQQTLLCRLAVFTGSFTLEAVEAVCSEEPLARNDMLDGISALADKSLLVLETGASATRYRLLETVRQYGTERLDGAGELEACHDRHADYFLSVIEEAEPGLVGGSNRPGLVEELGRDHDNLRAATGWCLSHAGRPERALRFVGAMYWFWYAVGQFREARRLVDRALALEGPVAPTLRGRALVSSAFTALAQGDYALACADLEKALPLLREGGGAFDIAVARAKLGASQLLAGGVDAAIRTLDELLADLSAWPAENMAVSFARFWRGWAAYVRGEIALARTLFVTNEAVGRAHRLPTTLAHSTVVLARIAFAEGDVDRSVRLAAEGLELELGIGDGWGLALAIDVAAAVAAHRHEAAVATRLLAGVEQHRHRLAVALPGIAPAEREALVALLRTGLGVGFEASYAEGVALSTEDVVELARATLARHAGSATPAGAEAPERLGASAREADASASGDGQRHRIRVRALGPLQVEVDGVPVESGTWGSARPRELLLYLLMHPQGRSKEQVGLEFWPDASPTQLRNNFHVTLHRLRKALGYDDIVTFVGDRYRVDPAAVGTFDVTRFERDVAAARRALRRQEEGAADLLQEALGAFQGEFLDGEPMGDWHLEHRDRLRRTYVDALDALARHRLGERRPADAGEACRRVLALDPLHEEAVRTLMESDAALGARGEALRAYQAFAVRIRGELGAEPARETTRLFQALQRGAAASA